MPSNTSLDWGGRRWAMALLPLPADTLAAARLLVHERWHTVQEQVLPLPVYDQFGAGAELLDRPEGRIWVQLEWRALARALESPTRAAETDAVRDALLFRARRYASATPAERERERLLDLAEGMPEYTAWKLTASSATELARWLRDVAATQPTFARSFQYYTGPAYGLLLDRRRPGWIPAVRTSLDLQSLLAESVDGASADLRLWLRGEGLRDRLAAAAERAGSAYGLASLRAAEEERWTTRQRRLAELRARFVDGPTLRIRPASLQIGFNPNLQTSLGDLGNVYGDFVWKTPGGADLSAPEGALVTPDWAEIRIPLDTARLEAGTLPVERCWTTAGWSLTLPAGWKLEQVGSSWVATPPGPR